MKFSLFICITPHDSVKTLSALLDSVASQSRAPDQLVFCFDGDVGEEIKNTVSGYFPSACTVTTDTHGDHGLSRAAAFDACVHEYVALADADDVLMPDRFKIQTEYLTHHPKVDVYGGVLSERGEGYEASRVMPCTDVEIRSLAKRRCPMNHSTVMMKRAAVSRVGGYLTFYRNEDYWLWVRMMLHGAVFENSTETFATTNIDGDFFKRRGGVRVFVSECKLFWFMYKNGMITFVRFLKNAAIRFGGQIVLTPSARKKVYKKYFRG